MVSTSKVSRFKHEFLSRGSPLIIVGAHDGLGAQLIEKHGFDGAWASGLEISSSHGVPDANILTMTQYLERAQEMNMASNIPVICDVDTGYGNSSNVHYMVQQYESAGMAAVVIEDKLFPKVNSFMPGRQDLASIHEFCGKLESAKHARTGDMLIIARVEALIAGWGMQEALKRAHAYVDAGADAILIHSKSKKPDEIREFLRSWNRRAPIVLVPTTYPDLSYAEMQELGVNMIIFANQCLRASIASMHHVLEVMSREKSTVSIESSIATVQEIFELQGMLKMKDHEKKFLRTQKTVSVIIPAAGKPSEDIAPRTHGRSTSFVQIGNKLLVERIADQLQTAGLQNIAVSVSKDEVSTVIPGVHMHVLPEEGTGLLYSIVSAMQTVNDGILIHYGDVIVSHDILRSFIASDAPITVMVSSLQREGRYDRSKKFDRVTYAHPHTGLRTLQLHPFNAVAKIGSVVTEAESDAEFIGVVFLNAQGVSLWQKEIQKLSSSELSTFSLCQFLMRIVDAGHTITTFEARSGWAEVHSVADADAVASLFSVTSL